MAKVNQYHSNDVSRRGVFFGNSIPRIAGESGYKNVALLSAIFAADGMAESGVASIVRTFSEDCILIKDWCNVTDRMFPGRRDFLDLLSNPVKLTLASLAKSGWLMTDTCNTANTTQRMSSLSIL